MNRHAYLIMAHNEFDLLKRLISMLDDDRADIYLHIDAKSSFNEEIKTEHSKLIYVNRERVMWGGYSQISCELNLLKSALSGEYQYYHLLSGVDLPIKSNGEIYDFFDRSNGKNYIGFDPQFNRHGDEIQKIRYYHFLQDKIGRRRDSVAKILAAIEKISISIQKLLRVNHMKKISVQLYKGANWFSITHDLAVYTIEHESEIQKWFYKGLCADEMFLQTIAMMSPYKDSVVNDSLRLTDWERREGSSPHTWTVEDEDRLKKSKKLFARKFSPSIDAEIIDRVESWSNK